MSDQRIVRFERDETYLREDFMQWLFFRSRLRWLILLALAVATLVVWWPFGLAHPGPAIETWLVLSAGYLALLPFWRFYAWRKQVLAGRASLPGIEMSISGGKLVFRGADVGDAALRVVTRSVRVWRGQVLYSTDQGKHLYLPDRWASREEVQELLKAVAKAGVA